VRVIGHIRTRHTSVEQTPVQAALNPQDEGSIALHPRYVDALEGLDGFSHLWLLTWLGALDTESADPELRQVPFLLRRTPRLLGVLATRGPRRPTPIGLSLVRLVAVQAATIRFSGVDMLDGTPLIDVKPYVARFDQPPGPIRSGWFDTVTFGDAITPASLQP
jgi:tRNA-Thr(GGU) m(6)t(6)A37 methyltransferase TsaA